MSYFRLADSPDIDSSRAIPFLVLKYVFIRDFLHSVLSLWFMSSFRILLSHFPDIASDYGSFPGVFVLKNPFPTYLVGTPSLPLARR